MVGGNSLVAQVQYQIKMENFEGPLDLLCHLVEKNKMDICDIKINDITNQYLDYLQMMQEMNLDITSDFIIMASKLIYLKSKSLLPTIVEDEEEENDLVQMLLEYKKYKEVSSELRGRLECYGGKFYRLPEKIELPKEKLDKIYPSTLIPDVYSDIIRREVEKKNLDADRINVIAVNEKVTIKSKIKEILKQLWDKPTFIFNKLFNVKKRSKVEVVTAFLSLLELSKMSRISITQDSLFGDINVTKLKRERKKEA